MTATRLFLDIHALQVMPPSNANRDDAGSPKTAQYGGALRARVSSQCWKRAIRSYFAENSDINNVGIRSLNMVDYLANKIKSLSDTYSSEEALKLAETIINNAGIKTKDGKLKALFFLGEEQANKLAHAAIQGVTDKKELQNIIKENLPIDIALFGRMLADDPSLNEDASSQVAHAISTHAVRNEFDYFTAIDDLAPEDNAGAGMLGTVEYNSSTLYRYANVAVHEFLHQLKNNPSAVSSSLALFIKAFANSMPTGKSNTFANQTLPQFLLVSLRDDRPVNLVSAFETPVKPLDGYVVPSIKALAHECKAIQKFVNAPLASFYVSQASIQDELFGHEETNLEQLLKDVANTIREYL